MKCIKPYGIAEYGCGQCMPCRINRRRLWTLRLLLETTQHVRSYFVTLTYAPQSLPPDGSLVPSDMQMFLKRLRSAIAPIRIRFYGVGEYGDKTFRPHYHLVLFGMPELFLGKHDGKEVKCNSCVLCSAWSAGLVHVGEVSRESAAYVASYTCKKMTQGDDPRLGGRHPEFARMSLRPGIGSLAADQIAEVIRGKDGVLHLSRGDVPTVLRQDRRLWPLGRYLRNRLRLRVFGDVGQPRSAARVAGEELQMAFSVSVKGELALRAAKRDGAADRARVKESIYRSKRGIGL